MSLEVDEYLEGLRGMAFKLFCSLFKTGGFDRGHVRLYRLIPPHVRHALRKRLIMFLLYDRRYRIKRERFFALWRRLPPSRRRNIYRLYCRHLGPVKVRSLYWLVVEALRKGMLSKSDFLYVWRPVRGIYRDRLLASWNRYLHEGCEAVKVFHRKNEATQKIEAFIEVRISGDPSSPLFSF